MNRKLILWGVGGAIIILLLGFLVSQVGNVGIRRVSSNGKRNLEISNPIVPGVATTVRWPVDTTQANSDVELNLKTTTQNITLGTTNLHAGVVTVVFPCTIESYSGSITLMETGSEELVSWTDVEILPPGQDCYLP